MEVLNPDLAPGFTRNLDSITVVPLGAGQDVGKSCILLKLGDKRVMLDCGLHCAFNDHRRFPDFTYIDRNLEDLTQKIDLVVITHFHLDHCGALPDFTERKGYRGPIVMTHPTKAICPLLLKDNQRVQSRRNTDGNNIDEFYTEEDIDACMSRVTTIDLHQTLIINDVEIKCYYAGHVLGAAMFSIKYRGTSTVYTGDYNMTPDSHLGAASIERLEPDLLITESTYATMVRDSKRKRERNFLKNVHDTIMGGGKVLVPVFALGRAQELFILIETYWERMKFKRIPIYFSAGIAMKANEYYSLFVNWTNSKIKDAKSDDNPFKFKFIKSWNREYLKDPSPMVIFSTPAMFNAGTSLDVFRHICDDPRSMVIMPGYCEPNTVGARVIAGETPIKINGVSYEVNCKVRMLSFSAHADAKGIQQMVDHLGPKNVILVHGEPMKMNHLQKRINEKGIPCYYPANLEKIELAVNPNPQLLIPTDFTNRSYEYHLSSLTLPKGESQGPITNVKIQGYIAIYLDGSIKMVSEGDLFTNPTVIPHLRRPTLYQMKVPVHLELIRSKHPKDTRDALQIVMCKIVDSMANSFDNHGHKLVEVTGDVEGVQYGTVLVSKKPTQLEQTMSTNGVHNSSPAETGSEDSLWITYQYPDQNLMAKVLSIVNSCIFPN